MIKGFQESSLPKVLEYNYPMSEKQDFEIFEHEGKCACRYKLEGVKCFYSNHNFDYPHDLDLFKYIIQNAKTHNEHTLAFTVSDKILNKLSN